MVNIIINYIFVIYKKFFLFLASSSYGYNPAPQELSNLRKFITTKLSPEVELALINLMKGGNRLKFVEMLLRRIKRLIEFVPIP